MSDLKTVLLKNYQKPDFEIKSINLHFKLDPEQTMVQSIMQIQKINLSQDQLILNGEELELIEVRLNNQILSNDKYELTDTFLMITQVPDQFCLEIKNKIIPAKNKSLEGLYMSHDLYCTQCEAQGFRKITYYLDRPDVMSVFTTTVEANKENYPILLSNGNLIDSGKSSNGNHWCQWHDPSKKPAYLFALVAGKLEFIEDFFVTQSGKKVTLKIFAEKNNINQCHFAMEALKKSMKWDEEVFNREYDLDIFMIVAVDDFNSGAMENKGLNIFNSQCILTRPDIATDQDYDYVLGVIAHEYFHNWTGNRITLRDWFQLSLKEGLTIFRDQEFSSDMLDRSVKRIDDVRLLRNSQFSEDSGPMAHPVRPTSYIQIRNFYTATVYHKGAELIRMMKIILGDNAFNQGIQLYFQRHDGQAVTTDDFVQAMSDASHVDLTQFKRWYERPGTPVIQVNEYFDPLNSQYEIHLKQSNVLKDQEDSEPLHIPIKIALYNPENKKELNIQSLSVFKSSINQNLIMLTEKEQVFKFEKIDYKPYLSFLREFSAPVKVDFERTESDYAFAMSNDPDDFNRWEAAQKFALDQILTYVGKFDNKTDNLFSPIFIDSFKQVLKNKNISNAAKEQILMLPSEKYISDQMKIIDIDGIHEARQNMKKWIAENLKTEWLELYQKLTNPNDYIFNAEQMGQRGLKNLSLDYLTCLGKETLEMAWDQLIHANNMTDQLAALNCLSHHEDSIRNKALGWFYERWNHEPLVMNKWFAVQARSKVTHVLSELKSLINHEKFNIQNPNNVRSLIGAFGFGNQVRFHEKSGNGYQFYIEQMMKIQSFNPQIAARLFQVFSSSNRLDHHRKSMIHENLSFVLKSSNLSKDVYEVVSKINDSITN